MKKLIFFFLFPFLSGGSDEYIIEMVSISEESRDEYSPCKFGDGLLISIIDREEDYYTKLYYAEIIDGSNLSPLQEVPFNLSNNYHIGVADYCEKNQELIFTQTNLEMHDGRFGLSLYSGHIEKDAIVNLNRLDFCSNEFTYLHPTLSPDGLELIFSSNMQGSGYKLFVSKRNTIKEKWLYPELIDELDIGGSVLFPKIINDSLMLYSAILDGGKGGLDIYKSKRIDAVWTFPENWKELNSESDDFGVEMLDETSGYFTSRRNSETDKIYYFEIEGE